MIEGEHYAYKLRFWLNNSENKVILTPKTIYIYSQLKVHSLDVLMHLDLTTIFTPLRLDPLLHRHRTI